MKKLTKFGILVLLLVSLVGSAIAFQGNQAAKEAMESGDYSAWKEARISGLTEDKFNQIREKYQNMQEKRFENKAVMDEICKTRIIPEDIEGPMADRLSENLDAVCQLHEARQNGMAKEELKGLGIEGPGLGRLAKDNFKGRCPMKD